jgi:hypothetical protein
MIRMLTYIAIGLVVLHKQDSVAFVAKNLFDHFGDSLEVVAVLSFFIISAILAQFALLLGVEDHRECRRLDRLVHDEDLLPRGGKLGDSCSDVAFLIRV